MWLKSFTAILSVTFALSWPKPIQADPQQIRFKHIAVEDGLADNSVIFIHQDSRGFVWIGTRGGLSLYNGYEFKNYKHDSNDSLSIGSNYVVCIYEDRNKVLWFGTWGGGLNRFNPETETFARFTHNPNQPGSLSDNSVISIYEDSKGRFWVGTIRGGLNLFDRRTGTSVSYQHDPDNPNSLSHNVIGTICEDPSSGGNSLWIGTGNGGINHFFPESGGNFQRYQHDPDDPSSLSFDAVIRIVPDPQDSSFLWIATVGGGICRLNTRTGKFKSYKNDPDDPSSLGNNTIYSLLFDRRNRLWVATYGGGVNIFSRDRKSFTRYQHDPADPNSLSDDKVNYLFEDKSGNIWVGTDKGGLNVIANSSLHFQSYDRHPNRLQNMVDADDLSNNSVTAIYEDDPNILWLGTENGLNRFDRSSGELTQYFLDPQKPFSLPHNWISAIAEDNSGNLLVGTNGGGLSRLNPDKYKSGRFHHYRHNPDISSSISSDEVISILAQDSIVWTGTRNGLNKFDPATGKFQVYKFKQDEPGALSNYILYIYADRSGILWIGSYDGLYRFNPLTEESTAYYNDPKTPGSISDSRVFSIYEDKAKRLWICTMAGLNRFDRTMDIFYRYDQDHSSSEYVAYGILEDRQNNLWISTNRGLVQFDPLTESTLVYDASDGLPGNEFNQGAFWKNDRGEMFFGGQNGLTIFHPDSIQPNPFKPPIAITDFRIFNKSATVSDKSPLKESLFTSKEIILSYKHSVFSFEFAALDYTTPEKNQYAYMLEGFHDGWIHLGTRRFVTFTNLDPGEYVLRVKGSNNDGIWNEEGTSLRITITPPPWKTWWAYSLYVLFAGIALYGIRRYELNRIGLKNQLRMEHLEAEKLKELDHLKSRFFANISHEFRTPLTLILAPLENAVAKISDISIRNQLHIAFENSRRLLRLINQLLDLSKIESGGMELKASRGNLIHFLKGILFTFESVAKQKKITLTFQPDHNDLEAYFDREKLEQVFYNLISNAVKFTPEGGSVIVDCDCLTAGRGFRIADLEGRNDSLISTTLSARGAVGRNLKSQISELVKIRVKDTGIGIPSKNLPHIFDRFYQVDSTRSREQEGTGIGLALAKEIVELHYGQISANSKEGKGTEFIVMLPLGKNHLKESEIIDKPESKKVRAEIEQPAFAQEQSLQKSDQPYSRGIDDSNEESEIILIVEDNQDVRAYIRQHLESSYSVIEAVDGEDGINKAIAAIPDLILSDVMMPKMDGYELCNMLKNDEKTSHVPIILLTAKAGDKSKLEGLETGADDYLTKPFNSKELLVRVKNLIEQRRRLREKFSREVVLKPGEIPVTSMEEQFLNRVKAAVETHMGDETFSVTALCREVGMSRVQLHRKLRALTDLSTGRFILLWRLQRAAEMLKRNAGTVAEIAYTVGFNTPNYFAKSFRKQFGCSPTEYKTKYWMN